MRSIGSAACAAAICLMMVFAAVEAQELADIPLPAPNMTGGKPLMEALAQRQTTRTFTERKLPLQLLSDLLWAAAGINREDVGKRTVPSARNWQEIEVWVILEEGAYVYNAQENKLEAAASGDLRKLTGSQEFAASAPLNLVYVADASKMTGSTPENQPLYMGVDTGFMSQNVYLFCASEGLATVVRGSLDRDALGQALRLPENKSVTFAQTVGYPAPAGE